MCVAVANEVVELTVFDRAASAVGLNHIHLVRLPGVNIFFGR